MVLLYIVLWLIEGGLRRWVLPQLSNPLLLIRDPLVIAIYGYAMSIRRFPFNGFVIAAWVLAVLEILMVPIGHGNPMVGAYGVRCDFLHIPMIFIIGNTLTPRRLMTLCKVALIISIPYTLLLMTQFHSPQSAWVNRGLGGSLEGAGFDGSGDYKRPPGTFSFITGPMALYPMFMACFFLVFFSAKDFWQKFLCYAASMAIVLAIPFSISRGLFIGVLLVAVTGVVVGILRNKVCIVQQIAYFAVFAMFAVPIAFQLQSVQTGFGAFMERWTTATTDQGGVQEAILGRVYESSLGVLLNPQFDPIGAGTGFSTNVGQKLISGAPSFGLSEGEFGRLIYDNGFLGLFVMALRATIALWIGYQAFQGFFRKDQYAMIFFAVAFPMLIIGQWAQPTSQGATTIAAGLVLAACQPIKKRDKRNHQALSLPATSLPKDSGLKEKASC